MGKQTNERNIAISKAVQEQFRKQQEELDSGPDLLIASTSSPSSSSVFSDKEITGSIIIERQPSRPAQGQELRGHVLTIGTLIMIVGIAWGSYQAVEAISDRTAKERRAALRHHNQSIASHPDLRRSIGELRREAKARHRELLDKLDSLIKRQQRQQRRIRRR